MSYSLWPLELQHTRFPILHYLPEFAQRVEIYSALIHSLKKRIWRRILNNFGEMSMIWLKWKKQVQVQFSRSVMSDSLQPHKLQHARPPCPSPTPRIHPNSCASSWWCHPAISSSVVPFSSCLQSLPASGSFPVSQLFTWGGQSIGSFHFSISPSNEYPGTDFLQNGLVGSPCSPRDSQESSPTPQFKSINSLVLSFLHSPALNIHTWPLEKP